MVDQLIDSLNRIRVSRNLIQNENFSSDNEDKYIKQKYILIIINNINVFLTVLSNFGNIIQKSNDENLIDDKIKLQYIESKFTELAQIKNLVLNNIYENFLVFFSPGVISLTQYLEILINLNP